MRKLASLCLLLTPIAAFACSDSASTGSAPSDAGSDSPTADGSTDANPTQDSGADALVDAPADQQSGPQIRCSQAEFDKKPADQTGGDLTDQTFVDVAFPMTAGSVQYVNHCIKVKVGTDVDFAGNFTLHPLEPAGGTTPTPIPSQSTNPPNGTSGMPELIIKMTAKGTYGYQCAVHASTMFGAIQVVD